MITIDDEDPELVKVKRKELDKLLGQLAKADRLKRMDSNDQHTTESSAPLSQSFLTENASIMQVKRSELDQLLGELANADDVNKNKY